MKQLLGYFFKALSFILASLPSVARDGMGHFLGFLWFDVLRVRRRVALENVHIAFPDLGERERVRIARSSLHHMGRSIFEYVLFPFFKDKHVARHFEFEGLEHVHKALEGGKGVIFLTAHIGNGDFALAALSRIGLDINLISKEFKNRWLNDLWFGMRARHGTRFIPPEKSSFEILRALKKNGIVVFVLDQFMGPPVGVRTRFFGRETGTAMGCALFAVRTGAPVLPIHTHRRLDGKHVITIGPALPTLDHGPRDENIAVLTQVYTDTIESMVRRHPEQWMWIHRRWKEFRD
jgi:Kdo2-lipid IVA lauroyltransferase/acyltransferase